MNQYVIYRVLKQYFAVNIASTSKIISPSDITKVPDSSDFILGVMDVEGEVLPIIDLGKRFFSQEIEDMETALVLVVYWKEREIGLLVDEVHKITQYSEEERDTAIEKITKIGVNAETLPIDSFIRAVEGIILELNLDEFIENSGSLEIEELFDFETVDKTEIEAETAK